MAPFRNRKMSSSLQERNQHRIVLLFDLDCFYAQCERVRLGLGADVCLALLQWNAVLAVTYPARKFGIKRGDSWDAVHQKSKGDCWAIHLQVLRKDEQLEDDPETNERNNTSDRNNHDDDDDDDKVGIQHAYEKIYNLTKEEQLECQKERGVRRQYYEGKACLERYRLASMRIFSVVLESLRERLGGKDRFVLERASIDEFYLDITNYCYNNDISMATTLASRHETTCKSTVVVGYDVVGANENDSTQKALQRACQVSRWIRQDVWDTLGFTMSAGISTNKMMAKLAASHGKPNGQAMLHPTAFDVVMAETKIRKVRNFGGKLGQQVLSKVLSLGDDEKDAATMGDLRQCPLPVLQRHFSKETAQYIFDACRGIDKEDVKETTGALVKSITAFKSFPANKRRSEIQNWLLLLAGEVTDRVTKDTARNSRYPRTCTLNYSYYTTPSGQRPSGVKSTRSQRQSRSVRLTYPQQSSTQYTKVQELVQQAMERLTPILQQHPLRGVGLSASNFETRGQPPNGVASIDNFFNKKLTGPQQQQQQPSREKKTLSIPLQRSQHPFFAGTQQETGPSKSSHSLSQLSRSGKLPVQATSIVDKDLELAIKLQASYDRENYVLSKADRGGPAKKKVRRIDAFFCKR